LAFLGPGNLCCTYTTDEEHPAIVPSFVCLAIRRNEKVNYIVDTPSAETIIEYTRDDGAEVESAFRGEQLSMITQADAYVRDGVFDREAMIALLDSRIPKAVADGYSALRVTGPVLPKTRAVGGRVRH